MSALDGSGESLPAKFHLDRARGKFLGVCQGLANYLGVHPMIVRLAFVLGTLVGLGSLVLVYFLIALLAD